MPLLYWAGPNRRHLQKNGRREERRLPPLAPEHSGHRRRMPAPQGTSDDAPPMYELGKERRIQWSVARTPGTIGAVATLPAADGDSGDNGLGATVTEREG